MGMNNIDFNASKNNMTNLKESANTPKQDPNPGDIRQFQEMFDNRSTQKMPGERPTGELGEKLSQAQSDRSLREELNQRLSQSQNAEQPLKQELTSINDLFSMQGAPQGQSTMEVGQVAPTESVTPPMEPEAMETLVSRILVGSTQSGDTEVRLTLNDNILRDTEISVVRDLNGNLTVKILCQDPSSFQTLVASRQNLQEALNSKEQGLVSIDLRNGENNEGNDTNQRSRGLDALEEQIADNV